MEKLSILLLLLTFVIGCNKNNDEDSIDTSFQIENSENNSHNTDNSENSNDNSQESSNDSNDSSNENSNNESSESSGETKDDSSNDSNSDNSIDGSDNSTSVDIGQYITVAEGSGNIELVSHSENENGIVVTVRITPSEGFTRIRFTRIRFT